MRMLQALYVHNSSWSRKSFDIKQAYCWAKIPGNKLLAVKYPKGFERYRVDENGVKHELYIVLRRNLYGIPDASRMWSQTRDKFLQSHFTKIGWAVTRSMCDPCLFHFVKPRNSPKDSPQSSSAKQDSKPSSSTPQEVYALIHTDDVDMIGSDQGILTEV